jgi:hypothetical protein
MNKIKSSIIFSAVAILFSGAVSATVYTVDTFKNPQSVTSSSNAALTKDLQIASPVAVTGVTIPGSVTTLTPTGNVTGSAVRVIGVNQVTNAWGNNGTVTVNPLFAVYGVSKVGALGFTSNNGYQYDVFNQPLPASYEVSYDFANQKVDSTSWIEFDINGVCTKPMIVNVVAPNGAVAQVTIPTSTSGSLKTLRLPLTAFKKTASGYPTAPLTTMNGFRMTWTSGGSFARFQLFEVRMNTLGASPAQCLSSVNAPEIL